MMNGYHMNGWGWAGMTLMAIIVVAILGLVWVVARRAAEPSVRATTAREQLDARLARGEIDVQEYRDRLVALSGHHIEG
jgi:putative membrane protein